MNDPVEIHIGNLLKAYVKKNRIRQSGWGRKANLNPKTIAGYLKRPTMRIDTLLHICTTLNYNFLKEVAAILPPDMPPVSENNLQARVAELELQNRDLELQVKTLEKALELVGRK